MTNGLSARAPKYHRVVEAIRREIRDNMLAAGQRLPAETVLAERFRMSVPTIRQALGVLRAEGLIESRHGIGTFVKEQRRLQHRSRGRYGARATISGSSRTTCVMTSCSQVALLCLPILRSCSAGAVVAREADVVLIGVSS
jgi:DNA-binding GntR family transcriptional regulator